MSVEIGSEAPDFTLKDDAGNEVSLSSFRGDKSVTVVFIPFAFTGVCRGELCELRDNLNAFSDKNNQVLAITCDSNHANRVWKEQEGFNFPILSDRWPHGAVAQAYGCFNEALGCAERATFVIDRDGKVVDTFRSGGLGEARPFESYTAALGKL
jgi:peroxiredoxin